MTICAALIVKNEEAVLERCLDSCFDIVDSYCIVDTGSSDATMDIACLYREKGKPVNIYQREWVNFGYNRQELIEFAQGLETTHLLLLDADMTTEGKPDPFNSDQGMVEFVNQGLVYRL